MRILASILILSAAATPVLAQPAVAPAQTWAETVPVGAPAPGATSLSPATVTAAQTDKAKDRVICRQETPIGSHLPRRVCTTAREREAARAAADRTQENVQGQFRSSTLRD